MPNNNKGLEKHVQTVLVGITTALLLWVGSSVSQSRTEIAVLRQEVIGLSSTIEKLEGRTSERYRSSEAIKDLQLRDNRIDSLESRIKYLEDSCAKFKENLK